MQRGVNLTTVATRKVHIAPCCMVAFIGSRYSSGVIVAHVGDRSLNLSLEEWPDEKAPYAVFYFGVDWDSEHGFQMDLELP